METTYGGKGRNIFRAPCQTRFDFSLLKSLRVGERVALKFEADAFNLLNHPASRRRIADAARFLV